VPLDRLASVPFVRISGRRSMAATLNPFFASAGLEPARTVMELGTWEGLKDAVRRGLGAAVVCRSVAQRELNQGELRVVDVAGFTQARELVLICSPQRRAERMTAVFAELLDYLRIQVTAAMQQDGARSG
jgi:DNA-binding transcriptional LysR family regulator